MKPAFPWYQSQTVQYSSVMHSCPTLCNHMECSTQASLSITNSWSLLKFMSIELVMPSNHLILYHPLLFLPSIFPNIRVFSKEQSIGVLASASVLPMNIQNWFLLQLTGLISLQSKGFSRVFSNTTVWKHKFFGVHLYLYSNYHIHTWLLAKP